MFGLITRERQAYVTREEVGGRAYVKNKNGNLGKALGLKKKPLRFA